MYLTTIMEKTYHIIKIRSLLLHIKGLIYDMEFLGIQSGELYELITTMIGWRSQWTKQQPDFCVLSKWFNEFHEELSISLQNLLIEHPFYLLPEANLRITKNATITPYSKVGYLHSGTLLPSSLYWLGKRYISLLNRLNKFEVYLPIRFDNLPKIVEQRFKSLKKAKKYNEYYLPGFYPLTSSLNIL